MTNFEWDEPSKTIRPIDHTDRIAARMGGKFVPRPTEADHAAWEKYGPAIFHLDMTGPEALAAHRRESEKQAFYAGYVAAVQGERDGYEFWRDQVDAAWEDHLADKSA